MAQGDVERDIPQLGVILHRFLTCEDEVGNRTGFFICEDRVVLDGSIRVTPDEVKTLLRATKGQMDGPGLRYAPREMWDAGT